ncbi:hypothetical protein [Jannaschia rubra]|uniref:hypothetical protein n=1 Tax=Jannaschia rubra TaxID=282197 RepID=UPI0024905956|nr:hypothetical protein [Jannaschia rubra]
MKMSEMDPASTNPTTRYPWQEELEQLRQEAKEIGHFRSELRYPNGKIPLSAALAYIEEHAARPEIMAALSNVGLREWMEDDDADLWGEFKTYLRLRQPTVPDRSPYIGSRIRALACGEYKSVSDPRLIEALLQEQEISDDRSPK